MSLGWVSFKVSKIESLSLSASFCQPVLSLTGKIIPSLTLEPTSLGLWCVLKTGLGIQPHGLNNYWTLGPFVDRQAF